MITRFKIFETIDMTGFDLKKYAIWDTNRHLLILEILGIYMEVIDVNIIYIYNVNKNELIKNDEKTKIFDLKNMKKSVIYTSNNLQDCIDIIPTIKNVNKYNL